ncbi:hypothetical protein BVIRIDIS_18220 [Blastochloris viridis]|uniref:Peptidoglycan binding-like domain-containing protein n=1 Tax=Blastochloris viridis TaxID=1079 RepID=A0A0S4Q3C7_BLAVI|nr:hypothetical protein BVIRIDIS_18220 [Blastochloris viridis]
MFGLRRADLVGLALLALGSGAIAVNALLMQSGPHPAPLAAATPVSPAPAPKAVPKMAATDLTGSLTPPQPIARPASLMAAAAEPAAPTPTTAAAEPARRTRAQLISDLQHELQRLGLYDGTADGVLGPKTEAAIRDIELVLAWRETGEPTEALLASLRRVETRATPRPPAAVPASSPAPTAMPIDTRILAIQRALARLGYGPLRPDGRPGGETRAAVQRFERDRNLPVTGEISSRLVRELAAVSGMPIE